MQDVKSEYKVLAAIFEDVDIINACKLEWFTENRRGIFKSMQEQYSTHGYVTYEGVEELYRRELPGELFITVTPIIQPVLDTLQRQYMKRSLKEAADQLGSLAQEYSPSLTEAETILLRLQSITQFDSSIFNASAQVLAEIEQKRTGRYQYLKTGLPFLDGMLGGEWPRKAISAIVASPGGAKTSLICNSQLSMVHLDEPIPTLFFSLEMSKEAILRRWASNILEIDSNTIRRGDLTDEQQVQIMNVMNYLNTLPIYIIDQSNISIDQMIPIIRYHVIHLGVQVVFIDYLQIMMLQEGNNRNTELGNIGKKAKELAKKLNIHICFISQITQGKEGVWQIRDSGDFVAVLDVLIKLNAESTDDVRQVEIEFMKQREGPLGKVPALFDGRYQKFS